MTSLRLPTTLSVIFGSFTLGLYVAIQGPTLMDLIDLLHVNNDIMSYSLAFASLAYSVGGLLSGFLFNYVNRQILISAYFLIFGISNIATPFISNYMIFSVITVFKMMCAGGTDCGANVWVLEMWPGQDSWLQALHFSFAVGCALGPLIVEPFLSVEYKENEIDKIAGKTSGTLTINDQNETRIHIPYGVSGLASILAAVFIIYLYSVEQRKKSQVTKLRLKQQAAAGEHILLTNTQHPAALEAGCIPEENQLELEREQREEEQKEEAMAMLAAANASTVGKPAEGNALTEHSVFLPGRRPSSPAAQIGAVQSSHQCQTSLTTHNLHSPALQQDHQQVASQALIVACNNPASPSAQQQQQQLVAPMPSVTAAVGAVPAAGATSGDLAPVTESSQQQHQSSAIKITSKAREQLVGRPPYYVMFAIALAALCLSFYCGIEITSMNYLATFAVNIDLQLPKSTAALMSSALTISFAVGRGFGIWIAAYMKPHKLFYLCAGVMATGNVLMLIFANTAEMLLWYSICLFGIGCGPMFPAIVSFYDDKISKVTNTVSGIFILGSMFNVALNSLIIGHHIIDNALILIVCNLVGSVLLLLLFATLHMLTKVKKNQRVRKFKLQQGSCRTSSSQQQQIAHIGQSTKQALEQQQQLQEQQQQAITAAAVAAEEALHQAQATAVATAPTNDDDDDEQEQPLLAGQHQDKQANQLTTPANSTAAPTSANAEAAAPPSPLQQAATDGSVTVTMLPANNLTTTTTDNGLGDNNEDRRRAQTTM